MNFLFFFFFFFFLRIFFFENFMNFANLVKMYAIARFARNLLYSCKAESLNLKVGIKRTNPNPKIKVSFHRSILR